MLEESKGSQQNECKWCIDVAFTLFAAVLTNMAVRLVTALLRMLGEDIKGVRWDGVGGVKLQPKGLGKGEDVAAVRPNFE